MRQCGRLRAVGGPRGYRLAFSVLVVLALVTNFQAFGTLLAVGPMLLPAAAARCWSVGAAASIALAIACLGLLLLSQLTATSSVWDVSWRLVVIGIGQGLFQAPNTRTIMEAAPRSEQGVASGILATGRVVGQSLSVALAGAVFATLGGAAAGTLLSTQGHRLAPAQVSAMQQTFVSALHGAFVVSTAVAGVRPDEMGLGPIPASRKALARADLSIERMDVVELNEAFASQVIACLNELGVDWRDEERVSPKGGAIALGHPLGASGARLAGTGVLALHDRGGRYALITMCIGVGQGIAAIVERI